MTSLNLKALSFGVFIFPASLGKGDTWNQCKRLGLKLKFDTRAPLIPLFLSSISHISVSYEDKLFPYHQLSAFLNYEIMLPSPFHLFLVCFQNQVF